MVTTVCITIGILFCIFLWFSIPYSPLKTEFEKECGWLSENAILHDDTFSKEVLAGKPELLQKHIEYCGLSNQPMMKYSFAEHKDADFLLQDGSPMVKMQYKQINLSAMCERAAFIDIKMGGILPFQGLDDNVGGKGRMKGVAAKLFTVFDVQGNEMDVSALVTVLSEGVICPSFFMHDDIRWSEIDSRHLHATLTHHGMSVSGIFEFNGEGAVIGFYTKDRYEESKGAMIPRDWRIECSGYKERNGIKYPTVFKAFWVYPDHEKIYFSCDNVVINYYY